MAYDATRLKPVLAERAELVTKRWMNPGLAEIFGGSGYKVDLQSGTVMFGLLLGPERNIDGVLHDMGHFVTMGENRIALSNFSMGTSIPSFCAGQIVYEHVPLKSYENELDAMVYERILQAEIGMEQEPFQKIVQSLVYMPSFWVVPGDNDQQRLTWLSTELERRAEGKTISDFETLWSHRMEILPGQLAQALSENILLNTAEYSDIHSVDIYEGLKFVISRAKRGNDERFIVISDYYESLTDHGCFATEDGAMKLIERIMDFNGFEAAEPSMVP